MTFRYATTLAAFATLLAGCAEQPRPASVETSTVELTAAELDALVAEQKVCAVTGEELGSMGEPQAVAVTDSKGEKHTVLICCESCREELLENPDEHLAKLAAAKTSAPQ